jgi:glycosyltransferase involved in cell wall biosynthesis
MNCLVILESNALAGPHVYVANINKHLNYFDMKLLIPKNSSNNLLNFLNDKKINYKLVELQHITLNFKSLFSYIFGFPIDLIRLVKEIKNHSPDIVYVAGGALQFKTVIAAKLSKSTFIWHLNDTHMPLIIRVLFCMFCWMPNGYVYASNRTEKYYKNSIIKNKKSQVIQSSVDTNYFSPSIEFTKDKSLNDFSINDFIVGVVANINPVKGLELLIDIAATIKDDCPNVKFVIVGPVSLRQAGYYKKLIKKIKNKKISSIQFIGSRADIRPFLSIFDLYLCVSKYESSPISIWEALAMGKPVITTDVGDVSDYISEDCGVVEASRDPFLFAHHIKKYINSNSHLKLSGEKARQLALENFDSYKCAQKHDDFFKKLLSN